MGRGLCPRFGCPSEVTVTGPRRRGRTPGAAVEESEALTDRHRALQFTEGFPAFRIRSVIDGSQEPQDQ